MAETVSIVLGLAAALKALTTVGACLATFLGNAATAQSCQASG